MFLKHPVKEQILREKLWDKTNKYLAYFWTARLFIASQCGLNVHISFLCDHISSWVEWYIPVSYTPTSSWFLLLQFPCRIYPPIQLNLQCTLFVISSWTYSVLTYMEWMIIAYLQRKVHIRNNSNDEYTKVNGRIIKIIFTTNGLSILCNAYSLQFV